MSLFDLSMKLKGVASQRRKLTGNILYDWSYNRQLPTDYDFNTFVNAYRGWIYICSSKNATSVAKTPLRLYVAKERKGQKIKSFPTKKVSIEDVKRFQKNPVLIQKKSFRNAQEYEEIKEHPFLDLINNVNNFMNRFTLFELTQLWQELAGNSYWYIVKNRMGIPQEIWPMPPQNMRIIPDKTNFIKGYEYQKGYGGYGIWNGSTDSIFYKEKEVVHFKIASPMSMYYGFPPASACFDEYILGENMNRYEESVFKNNGRLDGYFFTEEPLDDHSFERLKEEIRVNFNGVNNAGKTPLLDNGLAFKPLSFAPKDMGYDKGRTKIKEIITNSYGISLGLFDRESNRSNSETAVAQYLENAVVPRLIRAEEKINEKLLPLYDDKLFVCFDDPVPENVDRKLKEREVNLRMGYSTVNMERKSDGLQPLPNPSADVPWMAVNMAPADLIMENFNNVSEDNIDQEEMDKKISELNNIQEVVNEKIRELEFNKSN